MWYNRGNKKGKIDMTLITEEEMLHRLHNVLGDEYEVLSNTMADGDTYSKARAQIKHLVCGIVSDKNVVATIEKARKCPYCSEKANITKERFFDRLKRTYPGDEYILEGEYKGYSVPTMFRHNCGATFRTRPITLINGTRKHRDCSFTVDHTEPITIGAEEWKAIPDSNYSVSNYGRVRNDKSSRIMKLPKNIYGYPQVFLYSPEKKKRIQRAVHKLVAEAFIPNPEGLPIVNHMDESQDNNKADNLQWATYQYNATYGTLPERSHKPIKGKPVYAIFPDGTDMYFDKIGSASSYFGGSVTPAHIVAVLAGRQRTTGGLVFERA